MGRRTQLDPNEGNYEYIEIHSTTKDSAFDKSHEWIALNYNSANTVIQLKGKDNGKIIIKAVVPFLNVNTVSYCDYTLAIYIKDKKIKLVFNLGETNSTGGIIPGGYPPKLEIQKIEKEFVSIKNGIMKSISETALNNF